MKLSIIIPMYNAAYHIEKCLKSILGEIEDDTELIIVNDGSKDSSEHIAKGLIKNYSNVHLYSKKNEGVSSARNYGLEKAVGDYVIFVDSDDWLIPGWKRIINNYLYKADIVFFSNSIKKEIYNKKEVLDSIVGVPEKHVISCMQSPWSKLYSMKLIKESQIKFEQGIINGEDLLFNLCVVLEAQTFIFAKENIYYYNINPSSSTHRFNERIFDSNEKFIERINHILKKYEIDDEQRRYYLEFCQFNGVFMYAYKIASLSKSERKKYHYVYKLPSCEALFSYYRINFKYGIVKNIINSGLKLRWYAMTEGILSMLQGIQKIRGRLVK